MLLYNCECRDWNLKLVQLKKCTHPSHSLSFSFLSLFLIQHSLSLPFISLYFPFLSYLISLTLSFFFLGARPTNPHFFLSLLLPPTYRFAKKGRLKTGLKTKEQGEKNDLSQLIHFLQCCDIKETDLGLIS